MTAKIEAYFARILNTGQIKQRALSEAMKQGLVEYLDLDPIYFAQVKKLIDLEGLRRA